MHLNPEPANLRNVIIIRGCSTSGKSTFATLLQTLYPQAVICTADDYFYVNGKYEFNPQKLGYAHAQCQKKFREALDKGAFLVIVANTNTSEKEWEHYEEYAQEKGYRVIFLVVEKRHGNTNDHNVPQEVLNKQADRIKQNLKLK